MVPDPLRAVAKDRDRSERSDAQTLHPLPPLRREGVDSFDRSESVPHAGLGECACIPLLRCGGRTKRALREYADFQAAPAGVGVDFDPIRLKLNDAACLGKRFGCGRIVRLPFGDTAGVLLARPKQPFPAVLST